MAAQTVEELYDRVEEFSALLASAELHASGAWEDEFVESLRANFKRHGPRTLLSPHQQKKLEQIGKY
ncbi:MULTISPECIES: hypothetical protein [unclassified Pseudomonas]|uniref:hypothetical protein n=1 Tax=unclassified Pseudomonas TaxID=196821 RepID=UPI002096A3C4|nr:MULTISPECIES: hypothetical protein [unclassified Pseudomonas]MCO7503166.1 hypothetical protein [Pseudomonas sp. VE 267-6A]MCO7532444.1 hypothetical protein [Pseudomonas sp. 2]